LVKFGAANGIGELHPSDALALVATRLSTLNLQADRQSDVLAAADCARHHWSTVWAMSPADLYRIDVLSSLDSGLTDALPEALAEAAVILDNWHHFAIGMPDGGELPEAAVEVMTEFEGSLRYNSNPNDGQLIPGQCTGVIDDPDRDRTPALKELASALERLSTKRQAAHDRSMDESPGLPALLLRNTTWLPPQLACGHPDSRNLPDTQISPVYRRITVAGRSFASRPIRVAIAPLAETADCAAFVPTRSNASYTIAPQYGTDRLMVALENALDLDADLLMLPEMTVEENVLEEFGRWMRASIRERRERKQRPRLAYVFVGATRPAASGKAGTNYLRVLDPRGRLTEAHARQDKICRWNLTAAEQSRFGLDRMHGAMTDPVKEDIDQASDVIVFDIDGFGRLICLICASVNHNRPGDWLVHNARPDWIYAPVMDSSTCWRNCSTSPLEKWTILRAYRAACISRGRVIVTNSMTLQDLENQENLRTTYTDGTTKEAIYPVIEDPGICFAIDRRGDNALFSVTRAKIPVDRPIASIAITKTFDWGVDWADFDEEVRSFPPR
jgi:hypothetical protein